MLCLSQIFLCILVLFSYSIVFDLYRTSSPLLFSRLLSYWSVERPIDQLTATYYALGLIAAHWLFAFFGHHGYLYCQQFGMKLRVATSSVMFRKVRVNLDYYIALSGW